MSNVFLYLILGLLILLLIIGIPFVLFLIFLIYLVMELADDWKTIDWPESK